MISFVASPAPSKSILKSKVFWGIVASVAAFYGKKYGVVVDEAGLTNDLIMLAGQSLALTGRFTAKQPVRLL